MHWTYSDTFYPLQHGYLAITAKITWGAHIFIRFSCWFFSPSIFFFIVAKQWYVLVSINTCRLLSCSSICVIKAKHFREYHSQSTHIRCILCLKWPLISTITEERKNNGKQTIYTLRRQFNIMVFHLCGDIPSCFIWDTMRTISCSIVTHHFFHFAILFAYCVLKNRN